MSLYGKSTVGNEPIKSEGSGFISFPGPAIVENNELSAVTLETASNGNKYIKFVFTHLDNGGTLSLMEWEIDTETKDNEKKMKNQLKRLKHVVTKFYPGEIPTYKNFEGIFATIADFEGLAKAIIALLNPKVIAGVNCRLKTVYNYKDYISLPAYTPFMELSAVEPTKLKMDPSFDKMTKDNATDGDDALAQATNATTATGSDSDLPF